MAKRSAPEVNAGSMADIAFLLLIFFLVTTTIASDTGITRKLPPKLPDNIKPPVIKERNLFRVIVNKDNRLLVEDENMEIKDLKEATIAFLENNGDGSCSYCKGKQDDDLSLNPSAAVVSLQNSRETNYATYIAIQNEITAAYNFLLDRESKRINGGISYKKLTQEYKDAPDDSPLKEELKAKREAVRKLFPEKFSEAEAKE